MIGIFAIPPIATPRPDCDLMRSQTVNRRIADYAGEDNVGKFRETVEKNRKA